MALESKDILFYLIRYSTIITQSLQEFCFEQSFVPFCYIVSITKNDNNKSETTSFKPNNKNTNLSASIRRLGGTFIKALHL